jgi:hypothetical protein
MATVALRCSLSLFSKLFYVESVVYYKCNPL